MVKWIILCTMLFVGHPALGFKWKNRCSYNSGSYENLELIIWDWRQDFPLKLCVEWSDFTNSEKQWIKLGKDIWNTDYKNYKRRRWGEQRMTGIPKGNLFVFSCEDYHDTNVIPVVKEDLGFANGRYQTNWILFYGSYAKIIMNNEGLSVDSKNKKRSSFFKETFFIDVFMHELGHALGIPHLRHDDLMFLTLDACGDKSTVCRPSDLTFESFLAVYEPEIYTPPPPSPPLSCPTYRNGRMFLCP